MKCKFKVGDIVRIEHGNTKRIIAIKETYIICVYINDDSTHRNHGIAYINTHELIPGFGTKLYKTLS